MSKQSFSSGRRVWDYRRMQAGKMDGHKVSLEGFFFFFSPFFLFMDMEVSWARGPIGTAAETYATAMATLDPSLICDLCSSLQQAPDL